VCVIQARPWRKLRIATRMQEGSVYRLQTASPRVSVCHWCYVLRGKASGSLVPGSEDHSVSEHIGAGLRRLD